MVLSLELLNTAPYVLINQSYGNFLVISANVSQCFPYNLQQLPNVLQKYSLKQNVDFDFCI